ncbi:TetR/AcrR family transcriptional regulator [Gordonia desulfuricans]|uniref:TetR/AcrR family transcriptional regulator n=1 Tax=Gordonia desulfuricans TaxID=89051 RepID=A0A7K3LPZ3_9ACTN|nr:MULTISPECIES: TetR/AcrR family transcriptional regulator [Gordonia]EMP14344.2 TetR family transcriptional regulator [Gordonia sp. NB41Y]NDK90303.1 TetR/AcrR family transcriptional regulator [Gordonia desulfuricans]WLP89564.1 TetR/AcrR family transcriptional regulator [Gordonia sp. NB41Y]
MAKAAAARTGVDGTSSVEDAVRAVRISSRRRQLLDAAVAVMERTGFHQMSMQALAEEAGVSVGLFYKYFGNKEDILLAAIVDILEKFRDQLQPAMDLAGDDPVEQLIAGFRQYARIVDENRDAVVLTYRESRTLDAGGRERIKQLEVETAGPMREAILAAVDAGLIRADVEADLAVFDLMMLAHGWALKQWHFGAEFGFDAYVEAQLRMALPAMVIPERLAGYLAEI